ncbi:acylneuraminate cytidylyltransferase family protein [Amylibacter sp.]|nr:acylneuraminate cytidylyltransferase family protein [Amylibacter sp.]
MEEQINNRFFCFIPARSGSKRIKHKNIRTLRGHPLIAYTINAAIASKCFQKVIVCTDDEDYAAIARTYGAEVPFLRSASISDDNSPDVEWLTLFVEKLNALGEQFEGYGILRPTSPLRTSLSIQSAMKSFLVDRSYDSIRAVSACSEHPGKMWIERGEQLFPILPYDLDSVPWHSNQKSKLPKVYVQNASLEIGWNRNILEFGSISGNKIKAYKSEGFEGFDLNTEIDWYLLETLLDRNLVSLPHLQIQET